MTQEISGGSVTNGPCQFTATHFWSCITAPVFPLPQCKWPKEMSGSGKLSLTWIFQILWIVTGRQCCLRYMVQYPSVHLVAEALGNKQCRENWICLQLHCSGTVRGSAGSWMGTMDREEQRDRVKKYCGCSGVPQRQKSCFGRAEAAGAWTAQPGLQGLGSRTEHPQAMQPLATLFANFCCFFFLFSK